MSSKASITLSSAIVLATCSLHPRSSRTALMLACIIYLFFSLTQSLSLLLERILKRGAQVFHIPSWGSVFHYLGGLPLGRTLSFRWCQLGFPGVLPSSAQIFYMGLRPTGICLNAIPVGPSNFQSGHSPLFHLRCGQQTFAKCTLPKAGMSKFGHKTLFQNLRLLLR